MSSGNKQRENNALLLPNLAGFELAPTTATNFCEKKTRAVASVDMSGTSFGTGQVVESVFEVRQREMLKSEEDGDGGVPRAGDSDLEMEFRGARLRAPTPEHVSGTLGGAAEACGPRLMTRPATVSLPCIPRSRGYYLPYSRILVRAWVSICEIESVRLSNALVAMYHSRFSLTVLFRIAVVPESSEGSRPREAWE